MKILIQKLDEKNRNGRVYTTAAMTEAVSLVKGAIHGTIGDRDFKQPINLLEVSHAVNNLRVEDGYLVGDMTVLKTPGGETLKQLMDAGEIVFRPMGTGKIDKDGNVSEFSFLGISALSKDMAA